MSAIESKTIRTKAIDYGPGQRSLRVSTDGESLKLLVGWPDPWRPVKGLTLPAHILPDLIAVLNLLSTCPTCAGHGIRDEDSKGRPASCPDCNGEGTQRPKVGSLTEPECEVARTRSDA